MKVMIRPVVCGAYRENAYVVSAEGREDCVIIDPGDGLDALRKAVAGRRVGALLLTHAHFDHTLAAKPLAEETGAPVYLHAADREMLCETALNAYDPDAAELPAPQEMKTMDYGDALSVCGLDFEVLPTPGHSEGSVCLYLPAQGALFSGDTLFRAGYGRLDLYGGSVTRMRASLKRLFALPGEVAVYPGHGDATTIAAESARYRL